MKLRQKLIVIFVVGILLSPILYNVIVIRPRIYYIIDYDVDLPNREEIIHKVEDFNYSAYLNLKYCYPYRDISCYIDNDLIRVLKSRIVTDTGVKWWPNYKHCFRYSFLTEIYSRLYLTYNNDRIFSVKDQNNQSLIWSADFGGGEILWYLNFTQIPYVYDDKSTIEFSDSIFVKLNLEFDWLCGYLCDHSYSFEQFLILDENLHVLLIFIYYEIFVD